MKNSFPRKIDWPKEKTLEIKTPCRGLFASEMVAIRCDGDKSHFQCRPFWYIQT